MKYAPQNKRRFLVIGLILVVLVVGGVFLFIRHSSRSADQTTPPDTGTTDKINYEPATPEEKQQAADRKDEIVNQQNQPSPPPSTTATVTPTIVDASQYDQAVEVRAFVSVVESNATCTIVFKHGSATVTKQVPAIPDASTTRCTNLSVPRSEFSAAGTWDVTVNYASAKSAGSATAKVEVH